MNFRCRSRPKPRPNGLLGDPDDGIAERAARNTSLPLEAMRHLLDELNVPELDALPSP